MLKKSGSLGIIFFIFLIAILALSGCSVKKPKKRDGGPKHIPPHILKIPDAVPRVEPLSKHGNHYKNNSYVALKKRYKVMKSSKGYRARGIASWYGTQFHGRKTSNGERYNMYAMTAAHPTLPLPTYARVTNLENGKSVVVKINDRGPFHANRIIDLSYTAAAKLGIIGRGTGHVEVRSIDPRDHGRRVPNHLSPKLLREPPKTLITKRNLKCPPTKSNSLPLRRSAVMTQQRKPIVTQPNRRPQTLSKRRATVERR